MCWNVLLSPSWLQRAPLIIGRITSELRTEPPGGEDRLPAGDTEAHAPWLLFRRGAAGHAVSAAVRCPGPGMARQAHRPLRGLSPNRSGSTSPTLGKAEDQGCCRSRRPRRTAFPRRWGEAGRPDPAGLAFSSTQCGFRVAGGGLTAFCILVLQVDENLCCVYTAAKQTGSGPRLSHSRCRVLVLWCPTASPAVKHCALCEAERVSGFRCGFRSGAPSAPHLEAWSPIRRWPACPGVVTRGVSLTLRTGETPPQPVSVP